MSGCRACGRIPRGQTEAHRMNDAAAVAEPRLAALPAFEELRDLSARGGVDVATTFLYQAVLDSPQHGWFIKKVQALRRETKPSPPPADVKLVIVPGAFHRENPRSGSEEHTSELQSRQYLVCRLLLEKKKNTNIIHNPA